MKKVLIVNSSAEYEHLFKTLGFTITHQMEEANLVCYTGGEDVSPDLYGDAAHARTYNNRLRDAQENLIFQKVRDLDIPMVGICRGAQFLNVMSGGRMYQHVTRHTAPHVITDVLTGDQVYVSSTHHQMMMPASDAVLVAFSTLGGEREWYDGQVFKRDVSNTDYEVLYYKKTNCLCFQPHPEFVTDGYEDMRHYFSSLLKLYFNL